MFKIKRVAFAAPLLGVLFSAAGAAAAPALESTCVYRNPTSGTQSIAYPSEDCRQLYVLPPQKGKARVSAIAPKQNLDFCPAVKNVGRVSETTLASAAAVATRIKTMIEGFNPLSAEIDQLASRLNAASGAKAIAQDTFNAADARKNELVAEVAAAKSALDLCRILASCTTEEAEYTALTAELRTFLTTQYAPAQQALIQANATFNMLSAEYIRKTTDFATALQPLLALQDQLFALEERVRNLYTQYMRLSGFTSAFTYSTGWASAITNFQNANAGKSVVRMPIKRPRLAASAVDITTYTSDAPALLAFAVPGVVSGRSIDLLAQPLGTEAFTGLGKELDPSIQYENAFGDSVGAQTNVGLMGACPFYPTGLSGGFQGDANDLTAYVSMNATYAFDLQVRRGYEAKYNMASWVSRIEKVTKKGGFFSSKTLREVVEDANSSDWFELTFTASSSAFNYSPAEQERIKREVRGQLQERALLMLAMQMNILPPGNRPTPPPLQPTGAGTAANYLMKGCGYWSWCLGTSFVLSVLDSIFGSSEAVASFKRNNSVWVTEKVSGVSFIRQNGALTYEK